MSQFGFRCRKCGKRTTRTTDSRPSGGFETRRRRVCTCGNRFTTYEIDAETYGLLQNIREGRLQSQLISALTAIQHVREDHYREAQ